MEIQETKEPPVNWVKTAKHLQERITVWLAIFQLLGFSA